MSADEAYLICEGFHDCAFLTGALARLGWPAPAAPGERRDVRDPWGGKVAGKGEFGFWNGDRFLRIVPVTGDSNVVPVARVRLQGRNTKPLRSVVLCLDSDTNDDSGLANRRNQLGSFAAEYDAQPDATADSFTVDQTPVHLVVWRTPSHESSDGVPAQNTLEKVVCVALAKAKPAFAAPVHGFLSAAPTGPIGPKEHAWSYMAKWYASHGCDDFYRGLWRDESVAEVLEQILGDIGIWNVLRML